jgi:hypothetical protein
VYVQSKTLNKPTKFYIQAHPQELFSVIPSFGVLKPGENVALKVRFNPGPNPHLWQEMQGYLKIRSEYGFPTER